MFKKLFAWVMQLLTAIWIRDNVQHTLEEPPLLDEQPTDEGDPTLDLLTRILNYLEQRPTLSSDPFDSILYRSISTQIDNHSWFVVLLTYLSKTMQKQLEDTDESVYLDDPMIRGLSRGVLTTKELGRFLTEGKVRTVNDAFYNLLEQTRDVHYMYTKLRDHPSLSEVKKDYYARQMFKPIEVLLEYMDSLYLHGKINDSEKEANGTQSYAKRSRQTDQRS